MCFTSVYHPLHIVPHPRGYMDGVADDAWTTRELTTNEKQSLDLPSEGAYYRHEWTSPETGDTLTHISNGTHTIHRSFSTGRWFIQRVTSAKGGYLETNREYLPRWEE